MIEFMLNGTKIRFQGSTNSLLLDFLRKKKGLLSIKRGCEQGECGACTVLLDGKPVNSCMILVKRISGRSVVTLEGLKEDKIMKTLRKAFMEEGAVQCGFCTPGMLVSAYALLRKNPNPTLNEVKTGIEGNICRCTGYTLPLEAIMKASEMISSE
jgi:carbon-monoxide dehydrogenase small subunit